MPQGVEGLEVNVEDDKHIPDPGKTEGIKKDPKVAQNDIKESSPRFQEVYRELKEAQRKIEKFETNKGNSELIEEMRRHNASLEATIKEINTSKDADKEDKALASLNEKLIELRDLKKQAREKADFDTETKIDDEIQDLKLDIRELKKVPKAETKVDIKASGISDEDATEYKMWQEENKWFNTDSRKRAAAIGFEKKIISEEAFKDASLPEILEEVRIRVEEKFKPVEGKTNVETGGSSGSSGVAGKSVRLSSVEVDIAKGLGLTVEAYAKQKALMNQRRT